MPSIQNESLLNTPLAMTISRRIRDLSEGCRLAGDYLDWLFDWLVIISDPSHILST